MTSHIPESSPFAGRTVLITGGTGSFGHAVLERLLQHDAGEVRIFSRDEKKQDDMRLASRAGQGAERLRFYVGDVRDHRAVANAAKGADFIFHAAALKQVPSCEFHPMEAVKTNVLGTENVIEAALQHGVQRMVALSTDKAVYPINAMGMSKALMEKVVVAKSRLSRDHVLCITRYGNVLASRGSVIPLFVEQVRTGTPITITDPRMTRFMLTLDDAVDLVMHAFAQAAPGDIFVQKAPAASLMVLADALRRVMGRPDHPIREIGTRHGEKRHEALLSREEMAAAEDQGRYFRVAPDQRDLNYNRYVGEGTAALSAADDYSSGTAAQLDVAEMMAFLERMPLIKAALNGR